MFGVTNQKKAFVLVFKAACLALAFSTLECSRPLNRHFPFWTEVFRDSNKNGITAGLFASDSKWKFEPLDRRPKVHKPFGGMSFDFKDMEEAYNTYRSQSGQPTKSYFEGSGPTGLARYSGKSVPVEPFVDTTVRGMNLSFYKKWEGLVEPALEFAGVYDRCEKLLKGTQVFGGVELPVMTAHRSAHYEPGYFVRMENRKAGANGEIVNEKLRQKVSEFAADAGLSVSNWNQNGLGDLNIYAGLGKRFDYCLRCKSIDLAAAFGLTLPTAKSLDADNPLSFSFGRGGVTFHADLMAQVELKRGLRVGGTMEWCSRAKSSAKMRIPVKNEPAGWSPLKEHFVHHSGSMFRVSPHVTMENFMDWLVDFSVGFSYLKVGRDEWTDVRSNPDVKSFIQNGSAQARIAASEWSAKFFNLRLSYESDEPILEGYDYRPTFWLTYDHPFEREVDVSHRRFGAGVTFKF